MRIAMVGSGGVGGFFGGRLAAAGSEVTFIARGVHLEALRSRGLRIESPLGDLHLPDVRATADPWSIGPVDVVFFTVKLYDTDAALGLLAPLIGPDTIVVPLQNGVESVEKISAAIGRGHAAGGAAYLAAVVAEPGIIRHTANQRLSFGELDGTRSARLERLLDACVKAGLEARISDRIEIDIWTKFVWLSMFSGVTAVVRLPAGAIREDGDLLVLCQAAAMEGMAVAHAKGIHLPSATFADVGPSLQSLPPQAKSSLLEDLERGRRLELPWLSGAIVRFGEELGVPTPTHRFIKTVLAPHAQGRKPSGC
jgi:2-dehydropantoate 2-reductase